MFCFIVFFLNKKIQGYTVITWTEDDPVLAEKYINLGVDGIVTNVPENMLDIFKKRYWILLPILQSKYSPR